MGPRREREEAVQPARESPGAEQASARKGKPSCPPVGALGGQAQSLGAQVTLLEPCQPPHLSPWAQVQRWIVVPVRTCPSPPS